MSTVNIRRAIADDLPHLEKLERESFPDPWSGSSLRHDLLQGPGYYLVATQGNAVIGYISLWFVADEVQLIRLAVMPDQRRAGVGRMLLACGLKEARDRQAAYFHLEVRVSNTAAIHMYQEAGFSIRSTRKDAYDKPVEDGYLMATDIGE